VIWLVGFELVFWWIFLANVWRARPRAAVLCSGLCFDATAAPMMAASRRGGELAAVRGWSWNFSLIFKLFFFRVPIGEERGAEEAVRLFPLRSIPVPRLDFAGGLRFISLVSGWPSCDS
jgi:hypothetical protein